MPTLLCFAEDLALAQRLAATASLELAVVDRHRFPDGELKLRLPASLASEVLVWRSLEQPNEKLVELLLLARAARELGASHLTLVAPYLAYMRQDQAFQPGEAVSQRIVGRFLADLFDALITVDPHLHRVASLQQAVPVADAVVLSGAPLLADLIASHWPDALLIGPDAESRQWVANAATARQLDFDVCDKQRLGDQHVQITLPANLQVRGRKVVLMDDVASSGRTLAQAARLLLARGAQRVDVAVTHALFAGDAWQHLLDAGVSQVWSTDCIAHASNAVSMVPDIARHVGPKSRPGN